jgi:hypothetical protein
MTLFGSTRQGDRPPRRHGLLITAHVEAIRPPRHKRHHSTRTRSAQPHAEGESTQLSAPGMLGDRPAVHPRQPRQQAPHERRGPPPRFHPREPRSDAEHQPIELVPPPVQVYAEASGHRMSICSPHNSGSSGGGRATSTATTQHDHEVSLKYVPSPLPFRALLGLAALNARRDGAGGGDRSGHGGAVEDGCGAVPGGAGVPRSGPRGLRQLAAPLARAGAVTSVRAMVTAGGRGRRERLAVRFARCRPAGRWAGCPRAW